MGLIKSLEYFPVKPRWLFVKLTDEQGNFGWGEATLEGHSEAVEGALDALAARFVGSEAEDIENIWQSAYRLGMDIKHTVLAAGAYL
jgi:galactonate dehydratase